MFGDRTSVQIDNRLVWILASALVDHGLPNEMPVLFWKGVLKLEIDDRTYGDFLKVKNLPFKPLS